MVGMRKHRNSKKRLQPKPRASRTKIEAKLAGFLDDMHIKYEQNHSIDRYNVDFLIEDKYIVECYGDFWHCNPEKYPPDYYKKVLGYTAQERWDKDKVRQKNLEALGYQFLALWESEIRAVGGAKSCKIKVKRLLNEIGA